MKAGKVTRAAAVDRRSFLKLSGSAAAALAWGGCCKAGVPIATGAGDARAANPFPLPYAEASGTAYDCGRALGVRFGEQVRELMRRRADVVDELMRFVAGDPQTRYDGFLAAGRRHYPDVVAELEGWADGARVDFKQLLVLNLKAELGPMMQREREEAGCSTLVLSHGDRRLLAHNEDGDCAYAGLMFLIKVKQPGKPAVVCQCYPGTLPGNAPSTNEAGLVLTTNYIGLTDSRPGIPRYVLDRAGLDAWNAKEAIRVLCHPQRAFAFHYNLGSLRERKIWSVETSLQREVVREVEGLYVHTNHLIQPGTREAAQDAEYITQSSMPRYRALTAYAAGLALDRVDSASLIRGLSLHEGNPTPVCRHPAGDARGTTLSTSVFDVGRGVWHVSPGNPCAGGWRHVPLRALFEA